MFERFHARLMCGGMAFLVGASVPSALAQGAVFRDNFENAEFDPFWTIREQSGYIDLCQARVYSGDQAACFHTQNSGDTKNVSLRHAFVQPVFGRVSIWVFDTGADEWSSNYFALTLHSTQRNDMTEISVRDYDLRPGNGGDVYEFYPWAVWGDAGQQSPIDRTPTWHQWTIESRPDRYEISIDGIAVYEAAAGPDFDLITIGMWAPSWRPAWDCYFDDFEFIEYRQALPPCETSLALNWNNTGFPSTVESSRGWGGGSHREHINDGAKAYPSWSNGLAFTGGNNNWAGEPCGWRYAVIDFGTPITFEKIVIWHHGDEHVPQQAVVEKWNGTTWLPLEPQRTFGRERVPGSGAGHSVSDEYLFSTVTASKVRYGFDNCGLNVLGTQIAHGWIYEFDVFSFDAEPLCVGEMSNNGFVNNFDIEAFALAVGNAAEFHQRYPQSNLFNADIDQDGAVNNFDIDAFVSLLAGPQE